LSRLRVLHVIDQLRPGGPVQALIAATRQSRLQNELEHHIVSIGPADRRARLQASDAGLVTTAVPDAAGLRTLLEGADIVQAHFWNNPAIHAFLASELPPVRLLLWCHVNGAAPPHVIPKPLIDRSDVTVATTAATLRLPVFSAADPARVALVESSADFDRLAGLHPVAHDDFCVGYLGTVDFAKIHEAYVRMGAAADIPSVRFLVCGSGGAIPALRRQARELGVVERFEFHDYVDDVRSIFARMDVFGYPLPADTFATAELSLQEAMYAGIAPIVFAHGGPGQMVVNGETGVVVERESEYVAAIEWLYRNPRERKRLGENAARQMRVRPQLSSRQSDEVYSRVLNCSKRARPAIAAEQPRAETPSARRSRGAWSFVRSLDGIGDADVVASLTATNDAEAEAAERRIGRSSPTAQHVILQYRGYYPSDPHLRLWAGLILRERGRPALAASEFNASIALGCDAPRVSRYLHETVKTAGQAQDEIARPDASGPADHPS
jgi:glycosyltransferase involved in cell wall biosynthesis